MKFILLVLGAVFTPGPLYSQIGLVLYFYITFLYHLFGLGICAFRVGTRCKIIIGQRIQHLLAPNDFSDLLCVVMAVDNSLEYKLASSVE